MSVVLPLAVIALMVTFNALYVAAEFATVGSRRSRVQEAADGGSAPAARLMTILRDPKALDDYVAVCQIGITLSSLVAGAYGQAQLTPLLEPALGASGRAAAVLIVLIAITSVQVVLGELLPKTAALRYPERLAMATLPPMLASRWVLRPLVSLFNGSAFRIMRWWKLGGDHSHANVHSPEELAGLYRASAKGGLIDAAEREMLAGVLNVEDRSVREIMTPRRRMVTVPLDADVGTALRQMAESAHTRFPVTVDDDEIVGLVDLRDAFAAAQVDPTAPLSDIVRPISAVIDMLTVPGLWRQLREDRSHCAIVVNEFGSVTGMVTLEDALEEVFGEVQDEFDEEQDPIVEAGGRVQVRGDVLLEALEDRFGIAPPEVDVDTIGGLLWHELGRLPVVGDEIVVDPSGTVVRVDAMDGTAVDRASFDRPEDPT